MKAHRASRRWVFRVTFFLVLVRPPSALAEEGDQVIQQAAVHHERGIQLFQAGNHREAAAEFERAEQLSHSRANIMNLARCHQVLGENQRALQYIDQYLELSDLAPESRNRALAIRAELNAASPREREEAGGEVGREEEGRSLAGPWAVLGSGLAILLGGGVLDIVAYVLAGTDHDSNDRFDSHIDYENWRIVARNTAIVGDVLVGVGAAAAVGGLVWLLLARRSRSNESSARRLFAITPTADGGLSFSTSLSF